MWNNQGIDTLNGEQGKGSTRDSKFICSEYDDKEYLETNEIDSWERDHICKTGKITAKGNTGGSNWTNDIQGIQGILITDYSKQRRPNGGKLPYYDIIFGA